MRIQVINRPGQVHQVDVRSMPAVSHEGNSFKYLLVVEDIFSSMTMLMPLATTKHEEVGDSLAKVYGSSLSGGPPSTLSKRGDVRGAEILAGILSMRLGCRMDYSDDFYINTNCKQRQKKQAWSKMVKEVVLGVSRRDWVGALPFAETALNTSTALKDIDGKSPYHIEFGVPSARESRDPYQPDGIRDQDMKDIIKRAKRYHHDVKAIKLDHLVTTTVNISTTGPETPTTEHANTTTEHVNTTTEHVNTTTGHVNTTDILPNSTRADVHRETQVPRGETRRRGRQTRHGILGIFNKGNDCYVNSTLQSLAAVRADDKFRDLTDHTTPHNNHPWKKMTQVVEMLCKPVAAGRGLRMENTVQSIKNHFPSFANNEQQDCFDFFVAVMTYQQCPSCQGGSCISMNQLCGVFLANHFQCTCQETWVSGDVHQHFLDLDLPDINEPTTLQPLVDAVFQPSLCQRVCPSCQGQMQQVRHRQIMLSSSPVLVMRVKRWAAHIGLKNNRAIHFNLGEKIIITLHDSTQHSYEVKAAIVHCGATTTSGHYRAAVMVNGRSYITDDEMTQPTARLNQDCFTQCYMFFLTKD